MSMFSNMMGGCLDHDSIVTTNIFCGAAMHLHCDWASTGKELGLITRGVIHACQCWSENSHIPVILCLAVLQYMNDLNAVRGTNQKKTDRGSFWTLLFSLFGCCKKDQELGLPV
uniref:Uncharacterized protein n=1 Tax=Oryza rufipogon TaxID=4529 RepID=A0A0E0N9Y5_ORYRU